MKIMIPKECSINEKTINALKKEVKKIIANYKDLKDNNLKIYLCQNSLNIVYKKHKYMATIVEYKGEYYWYFKPYYNGYLLLKNNESNCYKIILLTIININS